MSAVMLTVCGGPPSTDMISGSGADVKSCSVNDTAAYAPDEDGVPDSAVGIATTHGVATTQAGELSLPSGTAGGLPDTLSPRSNSQIGTGGTDRRARS